MQTNTQNTRALLNNMQEEPSFDSRLLFLKILNRWPWILLSVIMLTGLGLLYNRYAEPVYKAQASILIKDEKKGGAGLLDNPLLKDLEIGDGGKLVDNEVEVLQSYDLMDATVRKEQLFIDIKSEGRFTNRSVFGKEFPLSVRVANPDTITEPVKWKLRKEQTTSKWQVIYDEDEKPLNLTMGKWYTINGLVFLFDVNPAFSAALQNKIDSTNSSHSYLFNLYSVNSTVKALLTSLNVVASSKTGSIINLEFTDENARRGQTTLNSLINIYNSQGLDDKKEVSTNTVDFLNGRLAIVARELQQVEGRVENYQKNNKITDIPTEGQQYLDLAKDIDQQKTQQQTQLNILESLETSLKENAEGKKLSISASGILEPSLAELVQGYNKLVIEKERQTERLGPKNPITVDLGNQITNTHENLLSNISSLKQSYRIALTNINTKDAELSARINNIPTIQKNLVQIKRDQSVKEQLYFFLLQKKEEAAITLASTTLDSRSIEKPRDTGIVKPNKKLVLIIAILLGLLIPVGTIYAQGFFDNKIDDKEEVEQKCKAPVLGEISFAKKEKSPIVIEKGSRSIIAEQFRVIRTNVGFTRSDGSDPKVILVTSHRPDEGKSFTSMNLAASFALLDKKVVVLEFDLRKPRLSQALKVVAEKGISNYLSSTSLNIDSLFYEVPEFNGNLSLLSAGPIPPNPAELILGTRMKIMMEDLKKRFDYIILDTPPFSLVTDSALLSRYADLSIVVLRHAFTFKFVLKELNKKIDENPGHPLYTVVNRVGEKRNYVKYQNYGYSEYFDAPEKRKKGLARLFSKKG
ncbi:MAG: polysaccharide biosynthesis tyrosine autokinase [Agriterribacter sp.]